MIKHYNVFDHPSTGWRCDESGMVEVGMASDFDLSQAICLGSEGAAKEWLNRHPQGVEDGKAWAKGIAHKAPLIIDGYVLEKGDGVGVLLEDIHYHFRTEGGKLEPWFIRFPQPPFPTWGVAYEWDASFNEAVSKIPPWVIELAQKNI